MRRRKRKYYRIFPVFLGILLLLLQLVPVLFALDDDAYDGYAADTLTVEVGYFGGPYYEKRVFTVDELWQMPLVQEDYTFIDNMPSVVIDHVVGVRLDDLMREAGIDINSIETFYFWTRDKTSDYYTSYSKTELLDTTRYCYYSLPENFDSETGVGLEGADAISNPVPTLMALSDDWKRCIQGAEFGSDFMNLDTATRFRLIFGQTDISTRTANRSAKWVHKIVVSLGGAPTITVDTQDLEMEVGSVRRISAQVHAADNAISSGASITWSSSDESVATVDQEGNVTMVGEGSAVITATSGQASTSFTVSSAEKDEEEQAEPEPEPQNPVDEEPGQPAELTPDPEPAPEVAEEVAPAPSPSSPSSPSAQKNSDGSASTNSSGTAGSSTSVNSPENQENRENDTAASSVQTPEEPKKTETAEEQEPEKKKEVTEVQGVTLDGSGDNVFPSDGTAPETTTNAEDELGGVQNWRVYEMSETAQELPEIKMDNPLLGFTGAASGSLLVAGGFIEYLLYRRRF